MSGLSEYGKMVKKKILLRMRIKELNQYYGTVIDKDIIGFDGYECVICNNDDFDLTTIFIIPGCNHKICRECLKTFCQMKLDEKENNIYCPVHPNCDVIIKRDDLIDIFNDNAKINKLDEIYQKEWLSKQNNIIFCPQCNEANLKNNNENNYECNFCNYKFCTICRKKYHDNIPCNEVELWENDEEKAIVLQLNKGGYKLCPNIACRFPMKKIGGCNHIICPKCHGNFNWGKMPVIEKNYDKDDANNENYYHGYKVAEYYDGYYSDYTDDEYDDYAYEDEDDDW